jgi:hypothetical protein
MGVSPWLAQHGFDLIQAVCVVGTLLFAAYTFQKNEKALRISNLLAIQQEYCDIWQAMYDRPELARVLDKGVNLDKQPINTREWLFVKMLILHLANIRRAMNIGMFVKLQGLQKDIEEFFSLPIPKTVWEKMKPFQDDEFVNFIESCLNPFVAPQLKSTDSRL